jgi:hypothetical protein
MAYPPESKLFTHSLLRFCCGATMTGYYARAAGTAVRRQLHEVDEQVMDGMASIAWEFDDSQRRLAALPPRFGGMGLTRGADHCGLAFIAASVAASSLLPRLISSDEVAAAIRTTADDRVTVPAADSAVASFSPVVAEATRYLDAGVVRAHAQRELSSLLHQAQADELFPRLDRTLLARCVSAGAPHASSWLAPPPGASQPDWLSPAEFGVAIRRRLGEPVASAPGLCGNCGVAMADVLGDHAIACMRGPSKWAVHNAMRDAVSRFAGAALWSPVVEPTIDAGDRVDVLLRIRGALGRVERIALDIATVSTTVHVNAAIAKPGGAATAYEALKRLRYGAAAERAGMAFVPLVADSAGAWGESSLPLFRRLAGAWGRRLDLSFGRAVTLLMSSLSTALMRGIAGSVLRAHAADALLGGASAPAADVFFS